jgi:type IV secretion system protein VirB10
MTETTINAQQAVPPEPELVRDVREPKGVLQKNLKPLVYLGAALLVILAAVFSGTTNKTPSQQAASRHEPPQPTVQDNTDNNVKDLKIGLAYCTLCAYCGDHEKRIFLPESERQGTTRR